MSTPMAATHPRDAGRLLVYAPMDEVLSGHELASHLYVAQRLADLLGVGFGGLQHDAPASPAPKDYVVPGRTLNATEAAQWNIESPHDLFGGVVSRDFIGTKLITHALIRSGASAPEGWSVRFAAQVHDTVLPGFSVFTPGDMRHAVAALMRESPVRIKSPYDKGGLGQQVVRNMAEFDACKHALDPVLTPHHGLVVERNLEKAGTISVGQVVLGDCVASYVGRQRETRNHAGDLVYGGTELLCARGGLRELPGVGLTDAQLLAVTQASRYHEVALACFPGTVASRANYDVVQGYDARRRWYSGVLEQSWRIGGASAAEVEAIGTLMADASRTQARVLTRESYDPHETVPADASVLFRGEDPDAGFLTKYVRVIPDAGP